MTAPLDCKTRLQICSDHERFTDVPYEKDCPMLAKEAAKQLALLDRGPATSEHSRLLKRL